MKKIIKKLFILAILSIVIIGITSLIINTIVKNEAKKYIIELTELDKDIDTALVLGARVYSNGQPCPMLQDRLDVGIMVYNTKYTNRILLSGDHGRKEYDEVNGMKEYVENQNIPTNTIFLDHAGFNTYESIYRAKEIFGVEKVVIVTQEYHLYRAVYIARKLGIEAYGIHSDLRTYPGIVYYNQREFLARIKDFIYVNILHPKPTYLGEEIPITGDGGLTHDKQ